MDRKAAPARNWFVIAVGAAAALGLAIALLFGRLENQANAQASQVGVTPTQLLINQRISQAAVKRVNAVKASTVAAKTLSIPATAMQPYCYPGQTCTTSLQSGGPGGGGVSSTSVLAGGSLSGAMLRTPLLLPVGATITQIAVVGIDPVAPNDMDGHIAACINGIQTDATTVPPKLPGCARTPGGPPDAFVTGRVSVSAVVKKDVAYEVVVLIPHTAAGSQSAAAMVQVTYKEPAPF